MAKTLLIIEDDPYVQRIYQRLFAHAEYEFDVASDGEEGLEKGLYLRLEKPQEAIPQVFADRMRSKEIMANLLSNSIKYTEKGGATVNILAEDGFIKIIVSDTGRGISEEQQNLLFRKFQQAGESLLTRDTTKGTGLSLFIAKMMSEGMGAKIYLDKSEVGKGSSFILELPVADPTKANLTTA